MSERLWSISFGKTVISKTKEIFGSMSPEEKKSFEEIGVDFAYIQDTLTYPGYYGLNFKQLVTMTIAVSLLQEKIPWDKRLLNTKNALRDLLVIAKTELDFVNK